MVARSKLARSRLIVCLYKGNGDSMMYIFRNLFVLQRVCSNVSDFNKRTLFLTAKLLKQGYR